MRSLVFVIAGVFIGIIEIRNHLRKISSIGIRIRIHLHTFKRCEVYLVMRFCFAKKKARVCLSWASRAVLRVRLAFNILTAKCIRFFFEQKLRFTEQQKRCSVSKLRLREKERERESDVFLSSLEMLSAIHDMFSSFEMQHLFLNIILIDSMLFPRREK
jgi:hypothetical protein